MRQHLIATLMGCLLTAAPSQCHTDEPVDMAVRGAARFASDSWTLATAPARLRAEHLPTVLFATGVAFLPAIIDRPLNDAIDDASSRDLDKAYDAIESFGRVRATYIAGGTVFAGGLATGNGESKAD